jgi:septal ring factor EnvC (AmiA/AmiB activator)
MKNKNLISKKATTKVEILSPSTKTQQEEAPKKYEVEEIFGMMTASSSKLQSLQADITKEEIDIDEFKTQRAELQKQIKPIRVSVKKFNPNGLKFTSVAPHDRKAIRHQIKVFTNQIILKEDTLATKKAGFAKYSDSVSAMMKKSELVNKAQSKNWTKRNRWSIEARIVKTLNRIKAENISTLRELAKLAAAKKADSKEAFDKMLQDTLDEYDQETSILSSYQLRSSLYASIRATLKTWDSKKAGEFTALTVVKD